MPIRVKTGTSTWSVIKKVYAKVNTSSTGWKAATKVFAKLPTGWIQVWPGDAPAPSLTDPIDIRTGGYNGSRATSPQYINTVLYGNDGTITGAQPITVNSRRMKISEDNSGNTTRYQLETTDVYNLTSNTETDIGFKRYMADGWWLFYELVASNVDSPYPPGTTLYSPAIKIRRQAPTFSTNSPSLSGDYSGTNPFLSLSFSFSDTWWKAADLSRSYVQWWQNTSKSPGGIPLKTTQIDQIPGLSDTRSGDYSEYNGTGTTVSGNDYYTANGGIPAGQYIIAEVVLINSYTDDTGSPISAFVSSGDKPSITSLSVLDDNGNSVVDNQSLPRIITDGYLNFTATVADASPSTYYLLEPRMYNQETGVTYQFNTSTVIGDTSFPTDLTPTSTSLNGTTATVTWRIFINASTLYGIAGPTYNTGQPRWQFEFRVSARASSTATNSSASYFTGIASLGGDSVYLQGLDLPAMVDVHPSSAMTLNVSSSAVSLGSSVTFSGTTVGYPTSTYSSYPRRYIIEYGDGTDSGWQYFATGTSNPSFSGINKTYSSQGTYTATLKWEPQGDPIRSTRSRTIIVSPPMNGATSTSVSVSRLDDTRTRAVVSSSGASGPYYQLFWTGLSTAPDPEVRYDAASTTSTITEDYDFSSGTTIYFYVRSSTENLGTTTTNGNGTVGTFSAYGPSTGAASYTFAQPTGSVSVSPSSGTGGTTEFTANASVSSAPSALISYQWQYFEGGSFGWLSISGATSSTYTPPSTYVTSYGSSLRCQITANNGVGTQLVVASSTITVSAPATKLSTPTNVSASDNRSDGIQVSWTNVSNASTYGVWYGGQPSYDSTPDFGGPTNRGGKTITGSPFLDDAVSTGTTRDYYVQAFPATGSTSYLKSDWSAGDFGTRVTGATVPGAPTNLFTSNITSSGATINWSAPTSDGGAPITSYEVNRDGGGFFSVGNVFSYNYFLSVAGTYVIGVRAVNSAGAGPAATISVTIPAAFVPPTCAAPSWGSGFFQRTSTLIRWYCDYPTPSGNWSSITGMQFEIRTTAGGGTLLASSTRAYPGAGSYPYAGGGTIWAFRCGTSDGDISYTASARYARARVVMVGTNGTTYYGTWTGWY